MSTISDLERTLARLSTTDEKASSLREYLNSLQNDAPILAQFLPSDQTPHDEHYNNNEANFQKLQSLANKHDLQDEMAKYYSIDNRTPVSALKRDSINPPPIQSLVCANYDLRARRFCSKAGAHACSGCKLVKYCSKGCQLDHWRAHKYDCKNIVNSDLWKPDWVVKGRKPDFVINKTGSEANIPSIFGTGTILWGNMPAIDILNLARNEGLESSKTRDFALAFVACGDLRNVIRTVNELPVDYSGTLSLVLNDINPLVMARNLLILLILTAVPDLEEASEHALHLWYSAFQPQAYVTRIVPYIFQSDAVRKTDDSPAHLTPTTTLCTHFDPSTWRCLLTNIVNSRLQPADASNVFNAIMNTPQRVDYIDRFYAPLKPGHRLAFKYWRAYGLLLPFGEVSAHMSLPNTWLFREDETGHVRLNLNDDVSPIHGWDLDAITGAGEAHGVPKLDILGSAFFYIKDQLMEFGRRLKTFRIKLSLYDVNALDIPTVLSSSPNAFDRIEVSNIVDANYCKVGPVLQSLGPLLDARNKFATLIGLFMNWTVVKPSGRMLNDMTTHPVKLRKVVEIMKEKLPKFVESIFLNNIGTIMDRQRDSNDPAIMHLMKNLDAFNDNSKEFFNFLDSYDAPKVAAKVGLKMRIVNRIVPPRRHTPLGSKHGVTVDVKDLEHWYQMSAVDDITYLERYVEWIRK